MKTMRRSMLPACAVVFALCAVSSGTEFYVSPKGKDNNPGSKSAPFATLEAARDTIRTLDKPAKANGVTVWIQNGTYSLDTSFELDGRDSGTKEGPVVYRAETGARVNLMGGRPIPSSAFKTITDKTTIDRLEPSAQGKVLQCDLKALGVTDYGQASTRVENELVKGAMLSSRAPVPELFFKNAALPLSRWPNSGFATYGKVIDKGSVPRFGDKSNRPGRLEYTGTRPERWTKAEHIFVHGYFAHDWFDDVLKVAMLDTKQKRITFTTPHMYGLSPNKRYRVLGLLEEIDQPGEWMIDHKTGILYLYPPNDMATGEFGLSILETPLIQMTGTAHVTIRGLTLEVTRGTCVDIAGGTDNLVAGCTLRNSGVCGVVIHPIGYITKDAGGLHQFPPASGDVLKDGRRNGVVGCDLYNVGTTGISMIGGDRKTLTAGEHYAINNDIHHFARRQRANQPAINMNGVGHRATHNFIHDAPHVGLDYSGNDHVIEYNELTRVCQETDDVGVIYSGRDWTYRGNSVCYNFIHDIKGPGGSHGTIAIYLDDTHSSTHIYGNVFYRVERAALIGGGRDNVFENNIIVDTQLAIYFDNRSEGWAYPYQKRGADHRMYAKLEEVNHDKPPYSTRYPRLATILKENPHKPLGNKVLNNICLRSKWITGPVKYLEIGDNLIIEEDPGFKDVTAMDFSLKDLAAVQKQLPGFKPIPLEKIGLQQDDYRSLVPNSAATADEKDLRFQLAENPPMETVWREPPDPVIPEAVDVRPGFTLITTLDEFRAAIKLDGQKIRLRPGIYRAEKLDPPMSVKRRYVVEGQKPIDEQEHIFAVNGSNNHFDLRGVVIETPVSLQGTMSKKPHVADCWDVNGANNVFEGGYFRNVVDKNYPNYQVACNEFVIGNDGNTFLNCTFVIMGSVPYGYTDFYGKGGPNFGRLNKHSCMSFDHANNTKIIGCKFYMRSFGHCLHFHTVDGLLIKDTLISGTLRPTNDILKETTGRAKDYDFNVMYRGKRPIPRDEMIPLTEDAIRSYDHVKNVKVVNTTVERQRGCFQLLCTGDITLENVTVREAGDFHFDVSAGEKGKVVMKNCKADLAYNPIFNMTRGDVPKNGFYEVTILNPAEGVNPTPRTSLGRI